MASALEEAKKLRESLLHDLGRIERVLTDLETQYHTADYSQAGNALKGYDGYLASKENQRKRARAYKPEDRLFSLSSRSTPAARDGEGAGLEGGDAGPGTVKKMGAYAQKGYAQKGYGSKQLKR